MENNSSPGHTDWGAYDTSTMKQVRVHTPRTAALWTLPGVMESALPTSTTNHTPQAPISIFFVPTAHLPISNYDITPTEQETLHHKT